MAQQKSLKDQVTGAWTIASVDQTDESGKKVELFGRNPKGTQIFDRSGQWVQIISNSDVPKFKVNNRVKGAPEENTAAVQGTTASFGTWSVDEGSKTLTIKYTGGLFPDQAGTESKRLITLSGDDLTIATARTASGVKSDTMWKRVK